MAGFASRQHGCVTRRQLLAAGFTQPQIDRRLRLGSIHPVLRGVYLVGHQALPPLASETAAILACAPRALLGAHSAAGLWSMALPAVRDAEQTRPGGRDARAATGERQARRSVNVVVVGRHRRGVPGVTVRSIDRLRPGEFRRRHGLPVTSPALTFLDLAADLARDDLADAIHDARHRGIVTDAQLHATLAGHPTRRGGRALAALLAADEMSFAIESRAEARCLRLMVKHRLKPDASQFWVGPHRVDFVYHRERLVVEADGYRHHGGRGSFDDDRRRTSELMARGYVVFPITWTDLTTRPTATMKRLRQALAARRAELSLAAPATFRT